MDTQNIEYLSDSNEQSELKEIVDLSMEAGRILLKSGAEIFRVEETIRRICNHYGVHKIELFTISHGIFITAESDGFETYTKVEHIPLSGNHLGIVSKVNSLSRDIAAGGVTKEEARKRLREIDAIKPVRINKFLGAALGAFGLGVTVGATFSESLIAGVLGLAGQVWVYIAQKFHMNSVIESIGAGMLTTIVALFAFYIPMGQTFSFHTTVGAAVLPLIPGVAFTNAIRDTADGDILSGTVRMVNALAIFVYIGIGVGLVLQFYTHVMGGVI